LLADAETGKTRVLLTRESDTYIDINDDLHFLSDGKSLVFTSEQDGYNHIYHYDMTGELIQQVTQGPWEVTALYGSDEKNNTLYFLTDGTSLVFTSEQDGYKHIYDYDMTEELIQQVTQGP